MIQIFSAHLRCAFIGFQAMCERGVLTAGHQHLAADLESIISEALKSFLIDFKSGIQLAAFQLLLVVCCHSPPALVRRLVEESGGHGTFLINGRERTHCIRCF